MEKIIIILIVVSLCILVCKILVPKVKLPLTEGKIREIMKPVCWANAIYRKVSDKILDETGIQRLEYFSSNCYLCYNLNARRLCAGVDLGHPVFSPEQAMDGF